ncbi:TetR/AcrR family transcriptional regulator [Vallitalea sp.]|jgi:AcrR family transcriptional regulator|uniref:TetR/AcrR family transcriptional regulator n=1 Tax=Vallitalea sp. TaxID=1882829 RepID=UPI0025E1F94A|nr:TetR/AcrR family transcriptional regulator [Vallitalea sp.]MCT4686108.1 TetR/AcrR family transcriptional regulator [Vallitalea sp.]
MMSSKTNQSELILDAAYKCVSEKGYANISLRDIAKEANVALSQLHYYFGSKKKLLQEIIKRMIGKYTTELEKQIKKSQSDKKEISNVFNLIKEVLERNPELFKILFDLSGLALRSDSFKLMLSDLFDHLSGVIKECIDESSSVVDEVKDFSSSTLSRLILGSVLGVAFEYTLDSNKNEDILDSLNALSVIFQ